ncbi:phage portal protein [Alkalilimnicola ehrlichii]|uniref:Phage portal protein n=1 Tax=Alkalilimnicola ehrlichii TaxID=351052 RepID=A0A3E0WRW2_9GAMM|nr:phage portal protein [Alkalilimnicola ehrlichii]RFA24352.1 phage portal protein [Alkalilimnicola ehrlichii]RFA35139.1 phage portal protein [Alkalilimnicola ehrlichii]
MRRSVIVNHRGMPFVANKSSYDSAGQGRRASNWYAPRSGPNDALVGSLDTLRNRSRAGYRNNPWIRQGVNSLVSNEIGTGIIPRSRVEDEDFRRSQNALWDRSADEMDADGVLDIYGMQALCSRTRRQAGEVFVRRRMRQDSDGLAVPIQFQILEPEFVPIWLNQTAANGNQIRHGIEIDLRGRRVAYWMYREHPDDSSARVDASELVRVPADSVIHHYLPLRPGQLRGEPVTAQALLKAYTFDSYDDAELVRKQTRAPYTGFIKKEYVGEDDWKFDPMTGEPVNEGDDGVPSINAEPGTFLSGLPGEEPVMFDGDDTGAGYADFMRQQILGMGVGLGVPYEILSGDWSKVNDRLVRAILHEFRRSIEADQDHLMIFQVCRRIWHWWTDAAVMRGRLEARQYALRRHEYLAHEWRPQGWPYLHPTQDVEAKIKAIEHNLASHEGEAAKTGWDLEQIQRDNVEAEKRFRELRREAGLPESSEQSEGL